MHQFANRNLFGMAIHHLDWFKDNELCFFDPYGSLKKRSLVKNKLVQASVVTVSTELMETYGM